MIEQILQGKRVVLSINRFERKKRLESALHAFAHLRSSDSSSDCILVVTGGHDERVLENKTYLADLQSLSASLNLSHATVYPTTTRLDKDTVNVLFIASFSMPQRTFLLDVASVLVYTPPDEHFGIVPLEAMYARGKYFSPYT